jgi:hypothetical protein
MKSYVLIDMSSSMAQKWPETMAAVNGYATEIGKADPDRFLAVYGFALPGSAFTSLTVLRMEAPAANFIRLGEDTPKPSGMTPLFDAIGMIHNILRDDGHARKTILVITDGEENASRVISGGAAKELIASWKAKEWDVTFLGADFNAFGQAQGLGLGAKDVLNASQGNFANAMASNAARSMAYASGVATQDLSFSDADRKAADGSSN